ncbi:MAG: HAMP domain-containing histidine kinase [Pseudobdellovibrionaceae bacterium]|nr:HAMP domain-containing histidine kinase [Pseudobdellovibrionaceae bacterium]
MSGRTSASELAKILRSQQERILMSWEERVRTEIASARNQRRTALRDHLPNFLTRLADALDPKTLLQDAAEHTTICETHGKERADLLEYAIPQVLHEYSILRHFVFQALETTGPLSHGERDTVLLSFDHAAREASEAFMDERTEREREKCRRVELDRDRTQQQLTSLEADSSLQKSFVATLTHDLRNPIGSLKMALDLLLEHIPPEPEVADLAQIMARNLEHAETMLNDLLDANRIKSGHKLPLNVEACDLTRLAKSMLAELSVVRGRGCILNAQEDIRGFWSEPRLRRVIGNLLDNAMKYGTTNAPITLLVTQNADQTTIAVHNEGTPIAPSDLTTIFEPYYRANDSGARHPAGWGLGLTLVRAVVEAHGGMVRVESGLQEGTTFFITLPNDSRPFQS